MLEIATTNGFLNPSKREADLAVMLARPSSGALVVQKLTDYRLGLFASPDYIAAHGPIIDLADLRRRTLIGYIPDFIYAEELRYLHEIDAGLQPIVTSSSVNMQYVMTRSGLGVCILPHFIGLQDASLVHVLPENVAVTRSFWMVVHTDLRRVARVDAVVEWLRGISAAAATPSRRDGTPAG
jgi:DNA-binding transcriptional LysR family regulator